MSDNDWDGMLAAAAGEVLETMFFAGVYGPAPQDAVDTEPRVTARVGFEGAPSGALSLSLSAAAVRSLAANFLASENNDPVAAAQVGGVVCELANMICGSLLSRVASGNHFRMSSPELLSPNVTRPPGVPGQSLDLGDGTIDLWLNLEHHAA